MTTDITHTVHTAHYDGPLGAMTLAARDGALAALWFDGQKGFDRFCAADTPFVPLDAATVFDATRRWLDTYFGGRDPGFTPPLSLGGTAFGRRVAELLLTIPYGRTTTYGQMAARLALERGVPRLSARAVGSAVGRNSLMLVVPCHRVVGAGGSLTGYAGGLGRKEKLLRMEMSWQQHGCAL